MKKVEDEHYGDEYVLEFPEDAQRLRAALARCGHAIKPGNVADIAIADAYVKYCQIAGALWLILPEQDTALEGIIRAILREGLLVVDKTVVLDD